MEIHTQDLQYEADGLDMVGTLYLDGASDPAGKKRAGVLLFPEAFGPGANVRGRAERLARMGYAALVCDLHGGGRMYDDFDAVVKLIAALREAPVKLRARANGAFEALRRLDQVDAHRIAAIGFCIGGTLALELGRSGAPLAAIVGFHSGLATQDAADARNISCEVLVCIGADDPSIPLEQRAAFEAEMKGAKVDWSMHLYGGVIHAFTNREADQLNRPEFARYDAEADAQSWASMVALFERKLA